MSSCLGRHNLLDLRHQRSIVYIDLQLLYFPLRVTVDDRDGGDGDGLVRGVTLDFVLDECLVIDAVADDVCQRVRSRLITVS